MFSYLSYFFSAHNFEFTPFIVSLFGNLLLNTFVTWFVVHFFYYPKGRRRDYYFTFVLLSVSIFMLIALLLRDTHDMGIGAALGLFAIFGIIRYRTGECAHPRDDLPFLPCCTQCAQREV